MKKTSTLSILLLAAFFLHAIKSSAQIKKNGTVSGMVKDNQQKPLDFATISLLKAKDSSLVKGALTDAKGSYKVSGIASGKYLIATSMVGYQKVFSKPFTISETNADVAVETLLMSAGNHQLKAVSVVAQKPLVERKIDRTVLNIENSVLAAGNSAMEILEKAPGVTVDKDDNISLQGKQGVTVMIDGKLTYLSSAQLATLLRSTDGNSIQSIEIITNPSAKYDASGNSGIINIKLKKNKAKGTNGNLTLTGGYGAYPKSSESVSLNHKEGKFNFFGSYNHGNRQQARNLDIDRTVGGQAGNTFFTQKTFMQQTNYYNNYRAGMDYDVTAKNTIGFLVNGYFNGEKDQNFTHTLIGAKPTAVDSMQNTNSTLNQTYRNFAFNLNDRFQIDTAGQELGIDLDYSKFNNNNIAQYTTDFFLSNGDSQRGSLLLRNQTPSEISIKTIKADYTKSFKKIVKLEAGFKLSDVKTDNDLQAQKLAGNSGYVNDTSRTNRFIYDEKISAGYVNLSRNFKKLSVQLGLRAENTSSNGNLITKNQVVNRNYLDFFPSLFLHESLSAKHDLGFSYSRRIDRPSYDNLNPFVYYLDQYTYSQGNPFLKPQYTQSFELNYSYNKTVNVSMGYSHTKDVMTEVILTVNKASYETHLNLQSQDSYNVNINTPFTFAKWWTGNVNLNGFYLGFKSDSLLGGNLNKGRAAFQLKALQTFTVGKTLKAELSSNYQSALVYGLFYIKPQYSVDAGVSRSFFSKKANVKFSVSDIFNTRRNDLTSNYQNTVLDIRQKGETRVARLTLSYNFGNSKLAVRRHNSGADAEKNRVNTGN
ncbi:outer membrane beta-barrel family protein [Mucilaginibacter arboris]|uniref:TonB-dependent receptor n=1 Tax=Mucilaginibacter arboris TaxID=2682090 RepID=A0A7K1SSD6_9SPHI|nr:outer membrane beta-barrel family protein [Mucilaginibacter arboris]MVN20222.1 TonB-dependent receptor [Mucilaginibacter arboris]